MSHAPYTARHYLDRDRGFVQRRFYGLLITCNLIKIVMVLQILTKAAIVALVLARKFSSNPNLGQSIAVTVIVVDTIVAVIGVALAIQQVRRHFGTLDTREVTRLQG